MLPVTSCCLLLQDFGHVMTKDRFDCVFRYLRRGSADAQEKLEEDPWAEVREWVVGYNAKRRSELRPGWAVVPDESMIQWEGISGPGGMPHLSFVPRKPKSLGCEVKTVCDCSTGVMLYLEIQVQQFSSLLCSHLYCVLTSVFVAVVYRRAWFGWRVPSLPPGFPTAATPAALSVCSRVWVWVRKT